jgi:hypothetical protein
MKLETIISVFQQRNKTEDVLILKVLNTIKSFPRKMDLKPAFREVKQVYEDYEEERQSYVKKLIKDYVNEQNELNKNNPNWKVLKEDFFNRVPDHKIKEYQKEMEKRKNIDVPLKNKLLFLPSEIENADLIFIEEEILDPFIDW